MCITAKNFLCNSKLFLCNNSFKMSITCFLWRILWFLKITAAWNTIDYEPENISTNSCMKTVRISKNISCRNKCKCSKLKNNTCLYLFLLWSWFIIDCCVKNRATQKTVFLFDCCNNDSKKNINHENNSGIFRMSICKLAVLQCLFFIL